MLIQPSLLKTAAQYVGSKVFVCGPGYASGDIVVRNFARDELQKVPNVQAVYGEEIEYQSNFKSQKTDLQTLEVKFAHEVDFTLLILESPGSIAELGTFTQLPGVRGRLIVLVSSRFFRATSYIARGPLSLLANQNQNSVIYYDPDDLDDMQTRVRYPLTFFKYARYLHRFDYLRNTMVRYGRPKLPYEEYMAPIRKQYNLAITLISVIVGDRASYTELLLLSGLAPKQLNESLHALYEATKVSKVGSGTYRATNGYSDDLLKPFSSTAISKSRARVLAAA